MKEHPEIDNPFALAWSMKNKGAESHVAEEDEYDAAEHPVGEEVDVPPEAAKTNAKKKMGDVWTNSVPMKHSKKAKKSMKTGAGGSGKQDALENELSKNTLQKLPRNPELQARASRLSYNASMASALARMSDRNEHDNDDEKKLHEKASKAHMLAAKAHDSAGNSGAAQHHRLKAAEHDAYVGEDEGGNEEVM